MEFVLSRGYDGTKALARTERLEVKVEVSAIGEEVCADEYEDEDEYLPVHPPSLIPGHHSQ